MHKMVIQKPNLTHNICLFWPPPDEPLSVCVAAASPHPSRLANCPVWLPPAAGCPQSFCTITHGRRVISAVDVIETKPL